MDAKGHQYRTSGPAAFRIDLNIQARVFAVDEANWANVQARREFRYVDGGRAVKKPTVVRVPRAGTWWIVIAPDSGTTVSYNIEAL